MKYCLLWQNPGINLYATYGGMILTITAQSHDELWHAGAHEVKMKDLGTSLAVQWLRHHASTAGDKGSIPGLAAKILFALGSGKKIEKKQINKMNDLDLYLLVWSEEL